MCGYLYSYTSTLPKQKLSRGSPGKAERKGEAWLTLPAWLGASCAITQQPWLVSTGFTSVWLTFLSGQRCALSKGGLINDWRRFGKALLYPKCRSFANILESCTFMNCTFNLGLSHSFYCLFPTNLKRSSLPTLPMFKLILHVLQRLKSAQMLVKTCPPHWVPIHLDRRRSWQQTLRKQPIHCWPSWPVTQWVLLMVQRSSLAPQQFGKHSQYSENASNEIRPVFKPIHTQEPRGVSKGVNILFFSV